MPSLIPFILAAKLPTLLGGAAVAGSLVVGAAVVAPAVNGDAIGDRDATHEQRKDQDRDRLHDMTIVIPSA